MFYCTQVPQNRTIYYPRNQKNITLQFRTHMCSIYMRFTKINNNDIIIIETTFFTMNHNIGEL